MGVPTGTKAEPFFWEGPFLLGVVWGPYQVLSPNQGPLAL